MEKQNVGALSVAYKLCYNNGAHDLYAARRDHGRDTCGLRPGPDPDAVLRRQEDRMIEQVEKVCKWERGMDAMSDYVIKVIPARSQTGIVPEKLQKAVEFLWEKTLPEDISAVTHDTPVFVDCGGNLEKIKCPLCGRKLDFGWWGEAMSSAAEGSFADLRVKTPCCSQDSSLNDLDYHFPCGFACVEIDIWNPGMKLDAGHLKVLEELFGESVRIIHSRL